MDLVFSEVSKAGLFCCGEVVRPEQSDVGSFPQTPLDNVLTVLGSAFHQAQALVGAYSVIVKSSANLRTC